MTVHEVEQIVARKRLAKAERLAFLVWACPSGAIPASDLEQATDAQWLQLTDAARKATGIVYGVPSKETRALVIQKLRQLERGEVKAA